jgi:serine/threonine protein kinase
MPVPSPARPSPPQEAGATPRAAPAQSGLPAQIGQYPVLARLGEGATSEVFRAWDPFRLREVAIKRVRAALMPDSREALFQRRFFASEAALVGRLQHPNVVQIHDAVAEGPQPYLVMELVTGGTLRPHCRADQLLPLAQVVDIGFKCAMALGYCSRQGLVHRDVKPANILAVKDGGRIVDVKITDFGSAFNPSSEHTQVFRVGSLAYMSPEQLDGDTLDGRADIYSLAAVLYHLIAGRPPFDAVTQPAIIQQIYHDTPPPLATLREGVGGPLESLIHAALSRRRDERPENWDDFAQGLAALLSQGHVPRATAQEVLDAERFALLRALEFFRGFDDVALWEVVRRGHWQRHPYGQALFRKGEEGDSFHIIAEGEVMVYRDGAHVATLGRGTSVGEMAYLAPSPELRVHAADVLVSRPGVTLAFTPATLQALSVGTRALFDRAFIGVLVRRLHAAHESLAHGRRIL